MGRTGVAFIIFLAVLAAAYFAPVYVARYLNYRNRVQLERRFGQLEPAATATKSEDGKKSFPYPEA